MPEVLLLLRLRVGLGFSGRTIGELKTYKQEFKAQAENTSNPKVSYQNPSKISNTKELRWGGEGKASDASSGAAGNVFIQDGLH